MLSALHNLHAQASLARRSHGPLLVAALALLALTPLAGCGSTGATTTHVTLNVFAAASLKDAFAREDARFSAAHAGVTVQLTLNGSNTLEEQLAQGAPGDVFASADQPNMQKAQTAGLLGAAAAAPFAHNRLVVVVPKANPGNVHSLNDLARRGLKIVVAAPAVPVGAYTLQALDRLGAAPAYGPAYEAAVKANFVSQEDNVKSVVTKVSLGEADAGVVYTTDATAAGNQVTTIAIPDLYNVVATYPIAALKGSANPTVAQEYVQFILSAEGQSILASFGFVPVQ